MSYLNYLAAASRIVRDAGNIARERFGRARIVREKQFHDIVTDVDIEIEERIIERLSHIYPDHGFYAEECGERDGASEYMWILDPIDGTKYYSRGVPLYAISLALQQRGQLVLGVVFDPQTGQLFTSALGSGAKLNDVPINCSSITRLSEAIVCVEIACTDSTSAELHWALERFNNLAQRVRRARILGVSALGMCYCAMGGFDAYVNLGSGSQYYDVAAGQAILQEGGANYASIDGKIVAGPRELFEQLCELIRE